MSMLLCSTGGTKDGKARRKWLGLIFAFCRNHFWKLYTNVRFNELE